MKDENTTRNMSNEEAQNLQNIETIIQMLILILLEFLKAESKK